MRILFFHLKTLTLAPPCLRALRSLGCEVDEVVIEETELGRIRLVEPDSWEGVILRIVRTRPDAIFLVNSQGEDGDSLWLSVAELLSIPIFNWCTDHPRFFPLQPAERLSEVFHLVLWDGAYTDEMRAQGYRHVLDLPLAGDHVFSEQVPSAPLDPPCDVAFVGSLGDHRIASFRREIGDILVRAGKPTMDRVEEWVAEGKAWARENRGRSIFGYVDALDRAELPEDDGDATGVARLVALAIDFENMREDRLRLARELGDRGLQVWGDAGWQSELPESQLRGFVPYDEAPRVYRDAKIVVNLSRDQLLSTVNQRIFDVPLAGGFLITDWRPNLPDFVEPGEDMAAFRETDELPELIERYLDDADERRRLSERARRRILERHTYRHRIETLLEWARGANERLQAEDPAPPLDEEWEKRILRVSDALYGAGEAEGALALAGALQDRGAGSPYGHLIFAKAHVSSAPPDLSSAEAHLRAACSGGADQRAVSSGGANLPDARHILAQILARDGRLAELRPYIETVPEADRQDMDHHWLAQIHQAEGRTQ